MKEHAEDEGGKERSPLERRGMIRWKRWREERKEKREGGRKRSIYNFLWEKHK